MMSNESNANCFRQVLTVESKNSKTKTVEQAFVVKPHAGRRELDLVGFKAQKEVKVIIFIASHLLLVKIRSYWSIIDIFGQIRELPKDLRNALYLRAYTAISSRRLPLTNQTMLLLQHKSLNVSILFNHRG